MDINYKIYKDRDVREEVKKLYCNLYYIGQRGLIFTKLNYVIWTGSGIFQALMIFMVHYMVFKNAIITEDGYNGGHWLSTISAFTSIILIVNLRLIIVSRWLNLINLVAIF